MIRPDISPGFRQRFDEARGDSGGAFSFGNALEFDGVNDEINFGSTIDLAGDFSISIWVKWTGGDFENILTAVDPTALLRIPQNNRVQFGTNTASKNFTIPDPSGAWHHILATRSGITLRVYFDGVESISGGQDTDSDTVQWNKIGISNNFTGVLDELYFWGGVVGTEVNAAAIYNGGAGVEASTVISNPTHVYRFNESGATTTLPDTGNGTTINGSLINFADPASSWVLHPDP